MNMEPLVVESLFPDGETVRKVRITLISLHRGSLRVCPGGCPLPQRGDGLGGLHRHQVELAASSGEEGLISGRSPGPALAIDGPGSGRRGDGSAIYHQGENPRCRATTCPR